MSLLSQYIFIIAACIYCWGIELPSIGSMDNLVNVPGKEKPISQCTSCKTLAHSFLKAVDDTTRQSFEGGDADWEREKLGNYENSEIRFVEIQEKLCHDVESGKNQCFNLAELFEHELETWFFKERRKSVDLFDFLCIKQLKFCCPENTHGPKCIPCPGGVEKPCGGNGKCMNGGTREESTGCICDTGYTGKLCDTCQQGYYLDTNSSLVSCKPCDISCKYHCRGPGAMQCEVCADGYHFVQNKGCVEKDENVIQLGKNDSSNTTEKSEYELAHELENVTSVASQQTDHSEL